MNYSLTCLSEIESLMMASLHDGSKHSLEDLLDVGEFLLSLAEFKLSLAEV